MATTRVLVLVCDSCQAEDDTVATHEVEVDGQKTEVEACAGCWDKAQGGPFMRLVGQGRRKKRARRRR